jgi:hypothetical protein
MSICSQLTNSAESVKGWFRRQPGVNEESITDWLLDDISSKERTVGYKQFTKSEESNLTGADWERWFILSHKKFFSAVIQAKKLFPNEDNYSGIMRKPKVTATRPKTELQIKTFRKFAKNNGFAALYAFYSLETVSKCPIGKGTEGVFITQADLIHRLFVRTRKRKILPPKVVIQCVPLSCMICCPLLNPTSGVSDTIPDAFTDFLHEKFLSTTNSSTSKIDITGFKNQLPSYLEKIIRESTGQAGDFAVNSDATIPVCRKVLVTDLRSVF